MDHRPAGARRPDVGLARAPYGRERVGGRHVRRHGAPVGLLAAYGRRHAAQVRRIAPTLVGAGVRASLVPDSRIVDASGPLHLRPRSSRSSRGPRGSWPPGRVRQTTSCSVRASFRRTSRVALRHEAFTFDARLARRRVTRVPARAAVSGWLSRFVSQPSAGSPLQSSKPGAHSKTHTPFCCCTFAVRSAGRADYPAGKPRRTTRSSYVVEQIDARVAAGRPSRTSRTARRTRTRCPRRCTARTGFALDPAAAAVVVVVSPSTSQPSPPHFAARESPLQSAKLLSHFFFPHSPPEQP